AYSRQSLQDHRHGVKERGLQSASLPTPRDRRRRTKVRAPPRSRRAYLDSGALRDGANPSASEGEAFIMVTILSCTPALKMPPFFLAAWAAFEYQVNQIRRYETATPNFPCLHRLDRLLRRLGPAA